MAMDPAERLLGVLSELVGLLQAHGERHWSAWLSSDLEGLRRGDGECLDHLLSAYGGMGSLNDLFICRSNGHDIRAEDRRAVNDRLWDLREQVAESARAVRATLN